MLKLSNCNLTVFTNWTGLLTLGKTCTWGRERSEDRKATAIKFFCNQNTACSFQIHFIAFISS